MRPTGMLAAIALTLALAIAPARSQAPAPPATPAPQVQAPDKADAFGEEVTLAEKTIIYFKGNGMWDSAFDTIVDAFKTLNAYLDKEGIKPAGPAMTIYTATDDNSFTFNAAVPVVDLPKESPKGDIEVGKSPTGKAYKFVHRGSYDSMDSTYEAITNFLEEKNIDAKDLFIEEYRNDPVATPEEKLVIDIYVPVQQ